MSQICENFDIFIVLMIVCSILSSQDFGLWLGSF